MSGTSLDGIDAAIVEITGQDLDLDLKLIKAQTYSYPDQLRSKILQVCEDKPLSIAEFARLDDQIAIEFAQAAKNIQTSENAASLIGSHGQTVYHRPPLKELSPESCLNLGYTVQLGRGEVIANLTKIPTVSNFRVADIALGGHGAPLVPKVDLCLLAHPIKYRVVQNLGGMGNLTYLPPRNLANWQDQVCGWDTGPGNVLIDLAISTLTNGQKAYDSGGEMALQGKSSFKLVKQWLEQAYFQQQPPKSTGRELFNQEYLERCWQEAQTENLSRADFVATITELTVASIVHSYQTFLPQIPDEILLCGGGMHNRYVRQRLQAELTSAQVLTTEEIGLSGDYKEAIAFAVLAYWRYQCQFPGNLPAVTSASRSTLLGEIHHP